MSTKRSICLLAIFTVAGFASANPVNGIYFDTPGCDTNGNRQAREELGTIIFPSDELISSSSSQTTLASCATDNPGMPNYLVSITNLSGQEWVDLFYVADVGTGISNFDGEAASAAAPGMFEEAFRIDSVGVNRPLVFESMTFDGVFEVGETWQFILQDFTSAFGGAPDDFSSLDFAGASTGIPGVTDSTGSIVQFLVPAPGSMSLLAMGGLLAVRRRR